MAQLLTPNVIKQNMIDNGYAENSYRFTGTQKQNVEVKDNETLVPGSQISLEFKNKTWKDTVAYNKVWNAIDDLRKKIKTNIATFDQTAYEALVDNMRIDITRRRFEYADLTPFIDAESDGFGDGKAVTLDEILPFGAIFKEENFRGGDVNLIDQKWGATGNITHQGWSCGWGETFENVLYNNGLDKLQRVLDSVARGFVARRNALSAGVIVGTTFDASQKKAAATSGTAEDKMYITLDGAIELIRSLKDPQTDQYIQTPELNLLVNPTDSRRIGRAVNGAINQGGKGGIVNRTPLSEINNIIPYHGDTIAVGKDQFVFPGVTKNKAYLYVPKIASFTRRKRGLSQETSKGHALNLSTEEMAWYFIQQSYRKEFFGSSDADVKGKTGVGYGFIIEIALPA